jgi:UDPglucose 6-dehydrogenase
LQSKGVPLVVFEPELSEQIYQGIDVQFNFDEFAASCDLILANRLDKNLKQHHSKVYSRDLFGKD